MAAAPLVLIGALAVDRVDPGWHAATIALAPDELRADDVYHTALRGAVPAAVASAGAGEFVEAGLATLVAAGRGRAGRGVVVGDRPDRGATIVLPPTDPARVPAANQALAARGVGIRFGPLRDGEWAAASGVLRMEAVTVWRRHRLDGAGVILATAGGEPWLVRVGDVVVAASRFEDAWTDLPLRPTFIPFLDALVSRLAHYDKGVPQTIEYPQKPLFHFLDEAARKYPDPACTIFKGAVISYKEMNALTDHMAAALVEMGVKKGDRVGIFMPNVPQFIIAYFGILKAGASVVAVNPTYPPDEIVTPVNDANIEIMFTLTRFYGVLKTVRERSKLKKIIVSNIKEALPPITGILFTLLKEKKEGHHLDALDERDVLMKDLLKKYENAPRPECNVSPDDTALFQYSGGTTGVPKGALAMHRNVVANTLQMRAWFVNSYEGQESYLIGIPLFHVYGMVAGMNLAMALCASSWSWSPTPAI